MKILQPFIILGIALGLTFTTRGESVTNCTEIKIFTPPDYLFWEITIETNGMVYAQAGSRNGFNGQLPPGSVDFKKVYAELKDLAVDHKVAGGTQVMFLQKNSEQIGISAISEDSSGTLSLQRSTTVYKANYLTNDQVIRDILPKDPGKWVFICPLMKGEMKDGKMEFIMVDQYHQEPISAEMKTFLKENPILPAKEDK